MRPADISIRKFEKKDAQAVSGIIRSNLTAAGCKGYPEAVINHMDEVYSPEYISKLSQWRKVYVALVDDVVVGTAGLEGDTIHDVFVDAEYHNKGIGKKLVGLLEEIASNVGMGSVKVTAGTGTRQFYEKLGYKAVGEAEPEESGKGIIMEKMIF